MASKPRPFTARITHLEMAARPLVRVPAPVTPGLAVMRPKRMPPAFYRYLYEQVGKPHHWTLRRNLDDATLAGVIHAETTEIAVLYADGAPAGFFELDLTKRPESVEILYFGLVPDVQGRGLGRFFLSEAIDAAWAHGPGTVTIHTNTLDSPRALHLYQKAGFVPVAWSEERIEPWA